IFVSLSPQNPVMEETVWEQYTVTLHRDPKMGFGIAVSGGRDNPNEETGETSIVVSDVLQGGPADGLLFEKDRVVQVNAIAMEGAQHSFAVQTLRKCGKVAKIVSDARIFNNDYNDDYNYDPDRRSVGARDYSPERERGGGYDRDYDRGRMADRDLNPNRNYKRDGSRGRTLDREPSPDRRYRSDNRLDRDYSPERRYQDHSPDRRYRSERALDRGHSPDRRYRSERTLDRDHSPGWGRDQDPRRFDEPPLEKPVNVLLLKHHPNEEYGLRLGSQLFIKEMTSTGLAGRDGNLQEGDIILKINGTVTENLSLSDAGKLIEKSRGRLQLVVQRDRRQVLIRIPPMVDSDSDSFKNTDLF
uniref:Tight junction protein 2 n=1 Tax=Kryptolebias marmoratus TaxID=37003 RepID=A0A3Q3A3U5_KRYMA